MNQDPKNLTNIINSDKVTESNIKLKKKLFSRVGQVALSLISDAFIVRYAGTLIVDASETAQAVIASEDGKEVLNQALKAARSKPAVGIAAGIVCVGCLPAAGVAASPELCVACGILISKVLG